MAAANDRQSLNINLYILDFIFETANKYFYIPIGYQIQINIFSEYFYIKLISRYILDSSTIKHSKKTKHFYL